MRVLQVYKDYYPVVGGIENTVRMLATEISRRPGFEMIVLTTSTGPRTERLTIDGVEVIKAGRQLTVASTPISWPLFAELGKLRPDITHLHFPYPWGEIAYLLAGRGRMILTYHSDIIKQAGLLRFYEPFLWRLLDRAEVIVATSPNYVESSPYLRRVAGKCTIVPCAVDIERFERVDATKVEGVRDRFGRPFVLFVGVFRYYKGLPYLIEAMKCVDARLVLVGQGPLESDLRALVAQFGLGEKVLFAGPVADEDLPSYYQAADVYVLPASQRSEALGMSPMEAMACGVPVVTTELGTGTSYVNLHGLTGLVVPPTDVVALAGAINRLLGDGELRRTMGEAGRQRVREVFAKEVVVDQMAELYLSVSAGARDAAAAPGRVS